jgi:hypothetical protein
MKYKFVTSLLLLAAMNGQAQIKAGETLVYAASYNMSGLMTHIAQLTLEAKEVKTSKNTFLNLHIEAATFSQWDSYFKIRDVYESFVNPQTLKPSLYKRSINEGGYVKTEKYVYQSDGTTIKASMRRRNGQEKETTITVGAGSTDIVTMLYRLRTLDFSKLKPGQLTPMTVVFDQKEVSANVKYMGKETINAGVLGKKECYKLSLAAKTDVLKGTDKNLVWLTADEKKIPAFFQFSIPVGTGQLVLKEIK